MVVVGFIVNGADVCYVHSFSYCDCNRGRIYDIS